MRRICISDSVESYGKYHRTKSKSAESCGSYELKHLTRSSFLILEHPLGIQPDEEIEKYIDTDHIGDIVIADKKYEE